MGLVGTLAAGIGGVFITQRRADLRDDKTWARERQREREVWEREDRNRTFDHRRQAYGDYVDSLHWLAAQFGHEVAEAWMKDAVKSRMQLALYATPEVDSAADATLWACVDWVEKFASDPMGDHSRRREKFTDARQVLLANMRRDLGVPETPSNSPSVEPG
jgi:hypothetical protein